MCVRTRPERDLSPSKLWRDDLDRNKCPIDRVACETRLLAADQEFAYYRIYAVGADKDICSKPPLIAQNHFRVTGAIFNSYNLAARFYTDTT
ncbi:hypothetical protein NS226_08340 [Aureimonas ureilytica]|uniref:Uncharacterized protein n=1 Tax=Aureimonas ureilytica TaxID=401562 RepID=A0A175RBZ2_9HYPH|nr:hypothetical protein NS226_08340 [Aureimonas ureilytica]